MKFRSQTKGLLKSLSQLGKGGEATVWMVESSRKRRFAVKKYFSHRALASPNKEIEVKRAIGKHPGLSLFIEEVLPVRGYDTCMLFKYYNQGDLIETAIQLEGHDSDEYMLRNGKVLWSGLAVLHKEGITHRDIKPENILWHRTDPNAPFSASDDILSIGDFGCSSKLERMYGKYPTQTYCPPEALLTFGKKNSYDKSCDVWSLGATWLSVLTVGEIISRPGTTVSEEFMNGGYSYVKKHHPNFWNAISTASQILLEASIVPTASDRATSQEIAEMLN